ncbi:alpha/beta fold hydrolase [Microbulbifer spongiae]|uniref:Alpha/beta hydrolase n=1 Tax=Microbulbifer spongiae TaxID=2944933 RepID=A0ABY9ECC1_9GAMM|nr:hypothetical protein [Microbulbifer sp. MI-G]WKD49606.1 hypothetical protein M8T91_17215 [Microbulbifer sp. MI-G]
MKLVLLPGLDGTGILFETVLPELGEMNVVSFPLPHDISQDYESLSNHVAQRLPDEDFILVAESFFGGIAAVLSRKEIPRLKGIIFLASFLSAPKQLLARLCSHLPIGYFARLPLSGVIHRLFFLGWAAEDNEIALFKRAIKAAPNGVLKARLNVIAKCQYVGFRSTVPTVYIGASNGMLIPPHMRENFKEAYPGVEITEIEGPHFMLQAQPKVSAAAIIEVAHLLISKGTGRNKAAPVL